MSLCSAIERRLKQTKSKSNCKANPRKGQPKVKHAKINILGDSLKSKILVLILSVLIVLFLACFIIIDLFPKPKGIIEDLTKGAEELNQVVIAIEKYKNENRKYPKSLSDLIPKYLEEYPILPDGFLFLKGKFVIEYHLLDDSGCQPYELSSMYLMGALSSDVQLYYRKNDNSVPTSINIWKRYKHKIPVNKNWVYCY